MLIYNVCLKKWQLNGVRLKMDFIELETQNGRETTAVKHSIFVFIHSFLWNTIIVLSHTVIYCNRSIFFRKNMTEMCKHVNLQNKRIIILLYSIYFKLYLSNYCTQDTSRHYTKPSTIQMLTSKCGLWHASSLLPSACVFSSLNVVVTHRLMSRASDGLRDWGWSPWCYSSSNVSLPAH